MCPGTISHLPLTPSRKYPKQRGFRLLSDFTMRGDADCSRRCRLLSKPSGNIPTELTSGDFLSHTPNALVACSLRSSAYVATASWNRPVISENGSTTKITDTLAPRDFASANPCATPCSASFDPSVGMRICRYMLHLPIAWGVSLPS